MDKLSEIYSEFGYCLNTLHSLEFEGESGFNKMQKIMQSFKEGLEAIANRKVIEILDYNKGLNGLPKSNVIKFILEGNSSVVVRPSGTETKIKLYFSISAKNKETAIKIENECYEFMKDYIYG